MPFTPKTDTIPTAIEQYHTAEISMEDSSDSGDEELILENIGRPQGILQSDSLLICE